MLAYVFTRGSFVVGNSDLKFTFCSLSFLLFEFSQARITPVLSEDPPTYGRPSLAP